MTTLRPSVWVAGILALIFIIIGVVYLTHTAGTLPHFFPGYEAGATGTHTKHGLAAFILAAGSLIYAWFQSAPKKD